MRERAQKRQLMKETQKYAVCEWEGRNDDRNKKEAVQVYKFNNTKTIDRHGKNNDRKCLT